MRFTVTRPGGITDADYSDYARILRGSGKTLGKVPRIPDPEGAGRRWVHVWESREEAQRFADDMAEQTTVEGCRVEPTDAEPTQGPFGPLILEMWRGGGQVRFSLHPHSRAIIQVVAPMTRPSASIVVIHREDWDDYMQARGLADLSTELAPVLTGLDAARLADIGYIVYDSSTAEAWVDVPSAELLVHEPAGGRRPVVPACA